MNSFVKAKAEQVVNEYTTGVAPISLDTICQKLNIHFMKLDREIDRQFVEQFNSGSVETCEGFAYLSEENEKYIKVKLDNDNLPHARFVLAHEIAHHVLNHLKPGQLLMSVASPADNPLNPIEALADEFARHLLVPLPLLKWHIERYSITDLEQLAAIFGVELEVITQQVRLRFSGFSSLHRKYAYA